MTPTHCVKTIIREHPLLSDCVFGLSHLYFLVDPYGAKGRIPERAEL